MFLYTSICFCFVCCWFYIHVSISACGSSSDMHVYIATRLRTSDETLSVNVLLGSTRNGPNPQIRSHKSIHCTRHRQKALRQASTLRTATLELRWCGQVFILACIFKTNTEKLHSVSSYHTRRVSTQGSETPSLPHALTINHLDHRIAEVDNALYQGLVHLLVPNVPSSTLAGSCSALLDPHNHGATQAFVGCWDA